MNPVANSAARRHDDRAAHASTPSRAASVTAGVRSAIEKARELDAADNGESLILARQAVALSLSIAAPALQAEAKECLARCQLHRGLFDAAMQSINGAIAVWSFGGDRAGEAGARCVLAELLEKLGQTDKALDEGLASLRLAEASGNLRAQTQASMIVGVIYTALRHYDDALSVLRRAEADAVKLDDPLLVARVRNNLGNVYNDIGSLLLRRGDKGLGATELAAALELYRDAAERFSRLGNVRLAGIAWRNAALGLSLQRRFDEADQILDRQLALSRENGSKVSEESALRFKGTAYLEQGRFAEAIDALLQACRIATEMSYHEREVESHEMLATAYEGIGDPVRALHHFRRFHDRHARLASDVNRRRARAIALQFQSERAKAEATEARLRAHDLEASNQALVEETVRLSAEVLIDPLTGLFNRRHLDIVLRDDLALRSADSPLSVALLDIDYFKRVNDNYSHQVGDDVLRHVGAIFRRECRQGEFAVRYGGEEFALIFPSATLDQARAACDRLRVSIERNAWHDLTPGLAVTVSAGVADNSEAESLDAMLAIADQRLYRAKSQGRNRVVATGRAL